MRTIRHCATITTFHTSFENGIKGSYSVSQDKHVQEIHTGSLEELWEKIEHRLKLQYPYGVYQYYVEDLGIIEGNYYELATGAPVDPECIWTTPTEPFTHYKATIEIFEKVTRPVREDDLYSLLHKE